MITEDYCSDEVVKLLNEKGFNEPVTELNRLLFKSGKKPALKITHQKAMKWLRETHKIIPIILTGEHSRNPLYYWFRIDTIIEGKLKDAIYREDEKEYSSYEQACEAAIKYCLEHLI